MAKREANNFKDALPPTPGPWRFMMASGAVLCGEVIAVFDDVVILETPMKETVLVKKEHIESYWEGKGLQEEQEGDQNANGLKE